MKLISRAALAVVFAASLTACGGFSSGLPQDKQLDALTAEEATQLCEAENEYFEAQVDQEQFQDLVCYAFALEFAEWVNPDDPSAGCTEFYEDCLDPEEEEEEDPCADAEIPPCTATVAEFELCVEELADAWNTYIADANANLTYSCSADDMETDAQWMTDNEFNDPQSCEDYEATCEEEETTE